MFNHEPSQATLRRAAVLLALSLQALACSGNSQATEKKPGTATGETQVLRIARSKQLTGLAVLEQHGTLEKKLAPLGYRVEWLEFLAGPQQFEAFNAGALDITLTAESPPLFAQAARGPVVYLAATAKNGALVSLVVPPGSPAHSMRDLRGKRVAFQKSSIGHYLTIKALEAEGMTLADIEQVNLAPPDASAALTKQSVDAWFIWEPFVTRAVRTGIGRVLLDGSNLRDTTNFVCVTRSFADAHPDVLRVYLDTLQAEESWAEGHPHEVAALLESQLAIEPPTLELMHEKTRFGVYPITRADQQKQQEVADLWHARGFLPRAVDAAPGFLPPERYAQLYSAAFQARASLPR